MFGQSQQATPTLFGQQQQTPRPLFGQTQPQAPTSTLFGQQQQQSTPSLFGQPATQSQPQPPVSAPLFGQTQQTASTPLFGQSTTQQPSLFGQPQTQTQPSLSLPLFGQTQQQTRPLFFGQAQQQQPSTLGLFGQPQPQQQQPQQVGDPQAFQHSVFQCQKFGDERDAVLAGLNYLQACWGSGKGHYSQTYPPAEYNEQNPFYRFKAVGYAFMYKDSNEDGQVIIDIKKSQEKVTQEESNIVTCLQQVLNKPQVIIRFNGTKAISEEVTMVIICAEDRNTLRCLPATEVANALCSPMPHLKTQLEALGVVSIHPKIKPSPEQLKRYLENPPAGIDPRVWTQAQEDNPDPNSMIPTPLVGSEALKRRIEWQEKETMQHQIRLKLIGEEVTTLHTRHSNMAAELQQMKIKHILMTHRLVSIICRQELMRKQGTTLRPEEEMLKKKLEEMSSELNSPSQYKGRLNELLSQINLQKSTIDNRPVVKCNSDSSLLQSMKDYLLIQQESIKHLVATVKSDAEVLKRMGEDTEKLMSSKR